MTEDQTQSDIKASHVGEIVTRYLRLGLYVYLGCMMGSILIPYLMGDTEILNELRPMAINYFLTCAFAVCVLIGFSLIRHKRND